MKKIIIYPNILFLKDLWMILGRYRYEFAFWYFMRFLSSLNALIGPYALAKIIDFFTIYSRGSSLFTFYFWILIIFFASIIANIIRLISKFKLSDIAREAMKFTRLKAISTMLNYSLLEHEKEASGNKIQRINSGADGIKHFMGFLSENSTDIFTGIFGVAVVFASLNIKYSLLLFIYIIFYLYFEFYLNKKIAVKANIYQKYNEKVSGKVHELASNIRTVKFLGLDFILKKRVNTFENKLMELKRRMHITSMKKWLTIQTISTLFGTIFLVLVGFDIINGFITLGFLALFVTYVKKTQESLNAVSSSADGIIESKYAIFRIIPFLKERKLVSGNRNFPENWKKVSFDNVYFKYKDKYVLNGFSLDIKNGEKIGVVGSSGEGKTTFFKLLMNLYSPDSGTIKIDSETLSNISQDSLTNAITVVPQDIELFNISFKDNITISSRKKSAKILDKAIKDAQCNSIVKRLPKNVNTFIGENGVILSGGEKQRVGIARALYSDSKIILLDEATSNLDSETETEIQKSIEKLKDKTIITVAHRLSTLRYVDRIIVINKGKIVEEGSFTKLLNKKGSFYRLYKLQENRK